MKINETDVIPMCVLDKAPILCPKAILQSSQIYVKRLLKLNTILNNSTEGMYKNYEEIYV